MPGQQHRYPVSEAVEDHDEAIDLTKPEGQTAIIKHIKEDDQGNREEESRNKPMILRFKVRGERDSGLSISI